MNLTESEPRIEGTETKLHRLKETRTKSNKILKKPDEKPTNKKNHCFSFIDGT